MITVFGTTGARLRDEAVQTVERSRARWPQDEEHLADTPSLRKAIGAWMDQSARRLLTRP